MSPRTLITIGLLLFFGTATLAQQEDSLRKGGVHIHVRHDNRVHRIIILQRPSSPPQRPREPMVYPELRELESRILTELKRLQSAIPPPSLQEKHLLQQIDSLVGLHMARLRAELLAPTDTTIYYEPSPSPADSLQEAGIRAIECALNETGLFRSARILFEPNSHGLLPISYETLNLIGELLLRNPDLRLEIAGHTDVTGPEEYNLKLSQERAEAVRQYLIEKFGIAPHRLVARGYGEAMPVAPNDSPTGRALNRRVEFRILR